MKRQVFCTLLFILHFSFFICPAGAQKRIYIPEDLRSMNLESDTSQWCWRRSAETRDLVFMWERGFGNDLQNPPQLDGRPMAFNLSVLMERVQSFYTFFRDTLGWIAPLSSSKGNTIEVPSGAVEGDFSKADRYKMMVMVMYSLEGTAYGGTYDNFIGALWVAPNRIQDKTMNCMAHELGHSFQAQIMADSIGECWGGTGFFEMTSQWMLWQVNPWWLRDENYHFEAFKGLTHKAFLHMENIYHSPYVIQWWSDLHGRQSIAELFRQGRRGEDPVITYKRMYGLSQQQFCDEMLRGYQHLINFDFNHARQQTRPYACTWTCPLDTLPGGWLRPKNLPEDYGFNAIPLPVKPITRLRLKGDNLRYAFVAVTTGGESIYGDIGNHVFRCPKGKQLQHLFLVVMGAPASHPSPSVSRDFESLDNPSPFSHHPSETYPYSFKVK
ncbi:MAG: hypothetical protein II949_10200 [Prevotella sp.]|nr:hypothetical protein [Prevotella sp.]